MVVSCDQQAFSSPDRLDGEVTADKDAMFLGEYCSGCVASRETDDTVISIHTDLWDLGNNRRGRWGEIDTYMYCGEI